MTQQPSNRTKLESAIAALGIDLELTGTEIADIFWLVLKQREFTQEEPLPEETPPPENSVFPFAREEGEILPPVASPETTPIYADLQSDRPRAEYGGETLPLRVPDAPSLREPLNFVRSLRPLMSRVNSGRRTILDEVATARETARQGICYPVLTSELEPWLDLALVVDENPSMTLWGHTLQELQRLFEGYGIFREVRVWGLQGESGIQLRSRTGQRFANPRELLDPSRRRLILIASDCVGVYWHDGSILPVLRDWARVQPLALLQMLPDWLWLKTGLRLGASVRLSSLYPGQANRDLAIAELLLWKDMELEKGINVPVLTLDPEVAAVWSQTLAGKSGVSVAGFVLPPELPRGGKSPPQARVAKLNARDRVKRFRQTASPVARKLAGLLSAASVICLPVVRLLQAALLPQSQPIHVAEVFLGGLLQPIGAIATDTALQRRYKKARKTSSATRIWYDNVMRSRLKTNATILC